MISRLIGDRPVRWASTEHVVGDYDGRERTFEVFNADARDQRRLLGEINRAKKEIEAAAGGAFIVIFHSVTQSKERHDEFVGRFPKPLDNNLALPSVEKCIDQKVDEGRAAPHWRAA